MVQLLAKRPANATAVGRLFVSPSGLRPVIVGSFQAGKRNAIGRRSTLLPRSSLEARRRDL